MTHIIKRIINLVIWLLVLGALIFWLFPETKTFYNDYIKDSKKYDSEIGKSVIILKDTFVIMRYSSFKQALILSNGSELSPSALENLETFKTKEYW